MYVLEKFQNVDGKTPIFFFGGASDDTEPTESWITEGSKLRQHDTGVEKFYHNGEWIVMVSRGGSGGGSLPANFPAEGAANANLYMGFDENGLYSTKTPPTVESPFFDVEFSYGAAGWAPNSATIAQILAAKNAGKIPKAIVELNTGTYAYGFICTSVETQAQTAVAFSINALIEGTVTNYVFSGIVVDGADTWEAFEAQHLPNLRGGSVGDVVTLVENDGTRFAAWSTPQ